MNSHRLFWSLATVLLLGTLVAFVAPGARITPAFAKRGIAAPDVAANWITTGNKTTNSDFLGTNNNKPLIFKTNKVERMRLDTLGNVGIGTNAPGSKLTVAGVVQSTSGGFKFPDGTTQTTAVTGGPNGWALGGNAGTNPATNFLGTTDNQALVLRTNNSERVRIDSSGNVGIGTNTPGALVGVLKSGGVLPNVQGVPTGLKVGTPGGTVPLAVRQNASEGATPALAYFETSDGGLGALGANSSTFVLSSVTGKNLALDVNGATRALTVRTTGKIGIGTTEPYALLTVKGADTNGGTVIFSVTNATNTNLFSVYGDGTIAVGKLLNSPVSHHVCLNGNVLSECNATAMYVPSIDDGNGFPETAEVVSIAQVKKFHATQDTFAVQKSSAPCDANLFGFIAKPEAGADGAKKNEHDLPLALSGNHAAKVTIENGTILRGDPLTSSSKPGYAMKATGACKIIGYALENAYTERTIQVFADLGENSASLVAELQTQVDELTQENLVLKETLAEIAARLNALEEKSALAQVTAK